MKRVDLVVVWMGIVVAVVLGGCAANEHNLVNNGEPPTVVRLNLPPKEGADCIARNVRKGAPLSPPRHPNSWPIDGGSYELGAFADWPNLLLAYARIKPAEGGSVATIWLRRPWFLGKGSMVVTMTDGC
jgi:hypothetical protein